MSIVVGQQFRFFVSGSFSPAVAGTNWTIGTPTDVLLTLAGVANGAGRQSDKVDLKENRALEYEVLGCIDFTGEVPTNGARVEYHWLPSVSGTQATGNVAGNTGADGPGGDGGLGSLTLSDFVRMAQPIGTLVVHDGASVQNGFIGRFSPTSRYGQLLVVNRSGDVFEDDDVEMHQVMTEINEA
jgi:hypothetical protein